MFANDLNSVQTACAVNSAGDYVCSCQGFNSGDLARILYENNLDECPECKGTGIIPKEEIDHVG